MNRDLVSHRVWHYDNAILENDNAILKINCYHVKNNNLLI